jgi:hypothetical protein
LTVSVEVTALVPVIAAGAVTEQVGKVLEFVEVTLHERETSPVNLPEGVTVTVEVPLPPGGAMLMEPLLRVKLGTTGAVTTTGMVVTPV